VQILIAAKVLGCPNNPEVVCIINAVFQLIKKETKDFPAPFPFVDFPLSFWALHCFARS